MPLRIPWPGLAVLLLWLWGGASACAPAVAVPHPRASVELLAPLTGFHGRVSDAAGQPVAGAVVYVYRSARNGLRGPADFAAETAADGGYQLDLVAGSYHLVARWRPEGEIAGPPHSGDAWAIAPGNPLSLGEGENRRLDFVLQGVTRPTLLPQNHLPAGTTAVSGRLLDAAGRPQAGAHAFAYRSPDFRHRPEWMSAPTPPDGEFRLFLPEGGRWCLVFRLSSRGQPRPGDPSAWGEATADPCRLVAEGSTLELGDIRLVPAP